MWIFVWICDADICKFYVEELIDGMQRTTYATQTAIMIISLCVTD